jgi:hypothetical protein
MTAIYLTRSQLKLALELLDDDRPGADQDVVALYVVRGGDILVEHIDGKMHQEWYNPETNQPVGDDDLVIGLAQCIEDLPPDIEMAQGLGMAVKQSF